MIRYDRLWATMQACGMTQYRLIKQYSFSAGQIGRLKKNMHVSTHTLDNLCSILECGISDIIEYIPDSPPQPQEAPDSEIPGTSGKEAAPPVKEKKPESPKGDKPKKAGKSKKGDKGDKKSSKDSKKGKDNKKNK